jgi:hypothetical protein
MGRVMEFVLFSTDREGCSLPLLRFLVWEEDYLFWVKNPIEGLEPGDCFLNWVMGEIKKRCPGLEFPLCHYFINYFAICGITRPNVNFDLLPVVNLTK